MKLPEPYQSLFEAMLWDCGAEAVPELVKKGANLNYVDPYLGRTPLYAATITDRVRTINALLENGADPNQRLTYRSPVDGRVEQNRIALHYAASAEATIALIKRGADMNAQDAIGTTPLMIAAFNGKSEVLIELLKAEADPSLRQNESPRREALTARELAEDKIRFWSTNTVKAEKEAAEERIRCYERIRDILSEAEKLKSHQ